MELSHNSQWAIMAHTALHTWRRKPMKYKSDLSNLDKFCSEPTILHLHFFLCGFSGTFLCKNNAFLIASLRKEHSLQLELCSCANLASCFSTSSRTRWPRCWPSWPCSCSWGWSAPRSWARLRSSGRSSPDTHQLEGDQWISPNPNIPASVLVGTVILKTNLKISHFTGDFRKRGHLWWDVTL